MKQYLNVPYSLKEIAKKNGARWDSSAKSWFFEGSELPENLKVFLEGADDGQYVNACGGMDCGKRGCDDCNY